MKTFSAHLLSAFSAAVLLTLTALPAVAQIEKMSNRELHAQTRKAERQARRVDRHDENAREIKGTYLNMNAYNMKAGAVGHREIKAGDGRENYQFNKKGEAQVTDAAVLTRKRLKKK